MSRPYDFLFLGFVYAWPFAGFVGGLANYLMSP